MTGGGGGLDNIIVRTGKRFGVKREDLPARHSVCTKMAAIENRPRM